ncbi:MAG: signal peptide peptidase SppA [Deltaproteobacteria bacterium]|nr:signal peptide peptidase SppA [Deltaproteobacteria bacterium]
MKKKKIAFGLIVAIFLIFVFGSIFGRLFTERIGVIEIEGVVTDSKEILEQIEQFKEDDGVKGVIVRIDSPGGASAPCQEIHKELKKLREKKKVFVSMGSVCASGGYYIAVAGEKIYAMPSTITGSIGVLVEQIVVEDLLKKIGLQANTIKAGEYKDTGSPFRKMKDEEKAYLKNIIDVIHEQFIEDVAKGRNIPLDKAKEISDGRIFTGSMAKEYKLIDKIGTFYDAVEDLRLLLNIKGKPQLVYAKKRISMLRWLISFFFEEVTRDLR